MIKRRDRPDGLPYRVYERRGVRVYSIGYKGNDGRWVFRLNCAASDRGQVAQLRSDAIRRAAELERGRPASDTFAALADAWMLRQREMPADSEERRADSTLDENERELAMLKKAFGHMKVAEMRKSDGYVYLDACVKARDPKTGDLRPRPAKGNKEIALARTVLEYGVRVGMLEVNPFDGIEKLRTAKSARRVTPEEIALAVRVGREMGGCYLITALGLRTAWLCVRRSVEVRDLKRDQLTERGIAWTAAKRKKGTAKITGIIEWSDELRATVNEALAVPRNKLAGTWFVFGNLRGQRYTKGGWKANLSRLMQRCVQVAQAEGLAFAPFSLQDCRPAGVSDKLDMGHADVQEATMHTSERMVRQIYDRRRVRVAKPVR